MEKLPKLAVLIFFLAMAGCINSETQDITTYYVDYLEGNDANVGTSLKNAWQSLDKVNIIELKAGDRILLKSGQEFQGSIKLKNLRGNKEIPIILSSFGKGRAIVNSGDSIAIRMENCHYVVCKNLIIKGSGRLSGNKTDGLMFEKVSHGVIDNIDASGYLFSGIHIAGGNDIMITHVHAHDNGFSGIFAESGEPEYGIDGEKFKTLKGIYIGHSISANNPGCPVITNNHSGSGILVAGVRNGVIEYCESMNNGWDMPREGNGPVGIWAYMSDSVTIQHCYAHHNRTSRNGKDGGGFDFDGGIRYSTMQYNLSAYNEGAGYGIFQYAGATAWTDNIARYNISYNDGSKNSHAGFFMWCDPVAQPMRNFHAYNNTIISDNGYGANFEPGAYEGFVFENNIFLIAGETHQFIAGKFTRAAFYHNAYWSTSISESLRNRYDADDDPDAFLADPEILIPDTLQILSVKPENMSTMPWFALRAGSACMNTGKVIDNNGGYDFWGAPVSSISRPNLGAWQGR